MKSLLFISVAILVSTSTSFAQMAYVNLDKSLENSIEWETKKFDFGTIERNKQVSTQFTFKNNSNKSVIIEKVKSSCGCTATNYPKEPVTPGQSANIAVSYMAKSSGNFSKTIWVDFNVSDSPTVLKVKGVVN